MESWNHGIIEFLLFYNSCYGLVFAIVDKQQISAGWEVTDVHPIDLIANRLTQHYFTRQVGNTNLIRTMSGKFYDECAVGRVGIYFCKRNVLNFGAGYFIPFSIKSEIAGYLRIEVIPIDALFFRLPADKSAVCEGRIRSRSLNLIAVVNGNRINFTAAL